MAADPHLLSKKAVYINDRLQVLDRLTNESVQLLDVLGATLHELTTLTAPIHSRATALTGAQRNIADAKAAVDTLLEHLDTSRRVQIVLEGGPSKDLDAFLEALSALERSNHYLQQHTGLAAVRQALHHSQVVFNRALEACEADFKASLAGAGRAASLPASWLRANLAVPVTDETRPQLVRDLVPPATLPKLRRMVQLMLDAQYAPAQQGYGALRGKALQQALQEMGVDLSPPPPGSLALMTSEQLDRHITTWNTQLRALTLLSLSEQKLADSIWPAPVNLELFGRLVGPHLASLLAAGHDITEAKKSPDKVFSMLDSHRHLSASLPVLSDMLGPVPGCQPLLAELRGLRRLAAAAAASLFGEYEASVARDANKMLPLDGTIHPLTAQVLSYLKRLLGYDNAADVMYGDAADEQPQPPVQRRQPRISDPEPGPLSPPRGPGDTVLDAVEAANSSSSAARSALATGIGRLLMQLLDNLEAKSKAYKNEAIAALFMMNNVHYVQWSVEASPALGLLGQDWLERHKDAVEDWGARYHDITWMPIINMLKADPPGDMSRVKLMLKETFAAFNAAIDRIYTNQSGWTIPDHSLRAAVKRVIKDDLLDTYQDFMRRYAEVQFTNNPAKYIKYAVSDVASIIDDDLFETKAVSMNKLSLTKEKLGAIV